MMKNVEWSAVSYLTNAIGRIPYKNNNSSYKTGYAGSSQNSTASDTSTYVYNSKNGVKGSSTHNVFGIYDINGGNWERLSAYLSTGESTYLADDVDTNLYLGALYEAVNGGKSKYVDVYEERYNESNFGDALYETSCWEGVSSMMAWDNGVSVVYETDAPGITRGGACITESGTGNFSFGNTLGDFRDRDGFRVVLTAIN